VYVRNETCDSKLLAEVRACLPMRLYPAQIASLHLVPPTDPLLHPDNGPRGHPSSPFLEAPRLD